MDLMAMNCNGLCVSQTSATSFQIPATNLDLCSGHSFRLPSKRLGDWGQEILVIIDIGGGFLVFFWRFAKWWAEIRL